MFFSLALGSENTRTLSSVVNSSSVCSNSRQVRVMSIEHCMYETYRFQIDYCLLHPRHGLQTSRYLCQTILRVHRMRVPPLSVS